MRTLPGTRDQGGDYTCRSVGARLHSGLNSGERSYLAPPPYSGERSSGERSYLAPPPYNINVSLSFEIQRGVQCLYVPLKPAWTVLAFPRGGGRRGQCV